MKERKEIQRESQKKTRTRITITMKKEEGEEIKKQIQKSGQTMNEFIINAIKKELKNNKL